MYLVLGLAAAAAALVLLYNRRREGGVDLTDSWVGRARQLAAVVLVLSNALGGLRRALEDSSAPNTERFSYAGAIPGDIDDEDDWR